MATEVVAVKVLALGMASPAKAAQGVLVTVARAQGSGTASLGEQQREVTGALGEILALILSEAKYLVWVRRVLPIQKTPR